MSPRYGMVVDLNRCVGCQTCTIACKHANDTPPGVQWRRVLDVERGTYPDVERLFLVAIWRNFVKGVSERRGDPTTPAMRAGLTARPWTWARVLGQRLFPRREGLEGTWLELYRRDWTTPELGSNTRHRRVYTY